MLRASQLRASQRRRRSSSRTAQCAPECPEGKLCCCSSGTFLLSHSKPYTSRRTRYMENKVLRRCQSISADVWLLGRDNSLHEDGLTFIGVTVGNGFRDGLTTNWFMLPLFPTKPAIRDNCFTISFLDLQLIKSSSITIPEHNNRTYNYFTFKS